MTSKRIHTKIPGCLAIMLLIIILAGGRLSAQGDVEAYAKLDTNTMMIGDQIGLELGINIPEAFRVQWPQFTDTINQNIEIIDKKQIDTSRVDGKLLLRQLFTITSFDSGYFAIPEVEFRFTHENDTAVYSTTTNSLYLMVNTPVVDTSQAFKVIKGPVSEPYTFAEILPWILIGLVVIALAVFMVWYIIKRRKNQPVFVKKPKPVLPPDVLALQKLNELRLAKVWQQGKLKAYHTELTDIAREYFDGRFDIDAMEMTSDEIIEALKNKQINSQAVSKMQNVLHLADLVKFAKMEPGPLENDLCLDHCLDFINETRPVVVPEGNTNKKEDDKPVVKEEV